MYYHPIFTNYCCDKKGNVFSKYKKLNPSIHHTGYAVINVFLNKKKKQYRVHRFIYECIVGNIPRYLVIDHIDNNKLNNCIQNLQLLTSKQNTRKAALEGNFGLKGEENPMSKLTNIEAFNLFNDICLGMLNKDLAIKYNLHPRYVSLIRHKKRWKNLWQKFEASTTSRNT